MIRLQRAAAYLKPRRVALFRFLEDCECLSQVLSLFCFACIELTKVTCNDLVALAQAYDRKHHSGAQQDHTFPELVHKVLSCCAGDLSSRCIVLALEKQTLVSLLDI